MTARGSRGSERSRRLVLVFLVALLGLVAAGGRRGIGRSENAHYVHLAQGWLQGRLHHEGSPPGACEADARARGECVHHRFDDWAVLWTLERADGTSVRGYPCRTRACAEVGREGVETWWVPGQGWRQLPRESIRDRRATWYVSFPPGPAVLMVPGVALFGLAFWDGLFTMVLAALCPVVLVDLLDRRRGTAGGRGTEHLVLAAAWTFGSPALWLGSQGQVWFTAQTVAALCSLLYLHAAFGLRRPALAGLCLGGAVACRPFVGLAGLFFAWQWRQHGSRPAAAVRFVVPLAAVVALLLLHNWVRFADPFEFGHRFLEVRWQSRMQETGMFSPAYLGRNLQVLLTTLPRAMAEPPFLAVSIHGIALWLSTPWLLLAPAGRERDASRGPLWLSAAAVAVMPLLYHNSGQVQFSYRFALDWLPMVVVAMGLGGAGRLRSFRAAVVVAALLHGYAAFTWPRDPARLFVLDPPGWPFEDELAPQ